MKKFLQPLEEWTVVRVEFLNEDVGFYAFNTLTGKRGKVRNIYDDAKKDVDSFRGPNV